MKSICLYVWIVLFSLEGFTQQNTLTDSLYFIKLNQQIDNNVVQKKVADLDTMYANDFIFSHGTGLIEGKESWLLAVKKNNYTYRNHDSVTVELHPDMAILRGRLNIRKQDNTRYNLKYVRVFAVRDKWWQMVSHITTFEQHEQ